MESVTGLVTRLNELSAQAVKQFSETNENTDAIESAACDVERQIASTNARSRAEVAMKLRIVLERLWPDRFEATLLDGAIRDLTERNGSGLRRKRANGARSIDC